MDKILHDALLNLSQGIVMLDKDLNISVWNNYMQQITGICSEDAVDRNVYQVLLNLNKNYFRTSIESAMALGCKAFFSAAMHKNLISKNEYFNLKISRIENQQSKYILLEFMNVTNEYIRINHLRDNVNQLSLLNKGLKEKQKRIRNLAYYDELTGVANRTLFYELAEKLLFDAKRNHNLLALMFIDVNQFKNINDTYGHEKGDMVLAKVAKVLKSCTRNNDVVARYGGDEFLVLLPHMQDFENHQVIASKIANSPDRFVRFDGNQIEWSLSIGTSFYPNNGKTVHQLIVAADKAMYIAKKEHQNCSCAAYDSAESKKLLESSNS